MCKSTKIKPVKYIVILWVGLFFGLAAAAVMFFIDDDSGYLSYALVFVLSLFYSITYYALVIDVLKEFGFKCVFIVLLAIIVGDKYLFLLVFLAPYLYLAYVTFYLIKYEINRERT